MICRLKRFAVLRTLSLQLAAPWYRRAARLLHPRASLGRPTPGSIGVLFDLTLFTDGHRGVTWLWPVPLGVRLIILEVQLAIRPMSIVNRVPEAP